MSTPANAHTPVHTTGASTSSSTSGPRRASRGEESGFHSAMKHAGRGAHRGGHKRGDSNGARGDDRRSACAQRNSDSGSARADATSATAGVGALLDSLGLGGALSPELTQALTALGIVMPAGSASLAAGGAERATIPAMSVDDAMRFVADQAARLEAPVTEMRIDLNPQHLGPMAIAFHLEGSKLRVKLTASNDSARERLVARIGTLSSALSALGFTADVEVGQEDPSFFESEEDTGTL